MSFRKAMWVASDRIASRGAVEELLADAVGWNIRDLVVETADDRRIAELVRGGAAVGVRVHLRDASVDALVERVLRHAVAGAQCDALAAPDPTARARLRALRPGLVLSSIVVPERAADGTVDVLCATAYRTDTSEVARDLAAARAAAPRTELWGGLMAYAGERERVRAQVRAARDAGCDGAILFAYDPAKRDVIDAFAAEAER